VTLRALAALAALALAAPVGAAAAEWFRAGDASLEVTGSLRELAVLTRGTDADRFTEAAVAAGLACVQVATFPVCPAWDEVGERDVWTSLTRLRLEFEARATKALSAVVHYDHALRTGTLDTFESALAQGFDTRRFADLEDSIVDRADAEWEHSLYRAFVRYETDRIEVTLGRQRIPWGVGRLWNPIDRFNAVGPLAIEADQSGGADALRVRYQLRDFTSLEAVVAGGARREDVAAAARFSGVYRDVDYGFIGGIFEEAPTFGFDLASNVGDAAARIEAVWTDPTRRVRPFGRSAADDLRAYWQAIVSADYVVDVGPGVYLLAEYLYNGAALGFGKGDAAGRVAFFQESGVAGVGLGRVVAPGTSDLLGHTRVLSLSRHLVGGQAGVDVTPELRADLLVIVDPERGSTSWFPSLRWSPTGWLELTLAGQLFTGKRRSEYGTAEPLGFALVDVFF
jgi:hypothetical protein